MQHCEESIVISNLTKQYDLFASRKDKVIKALGIQWMFPWRKVKSEQFQALNEVNLVVRKGERLGIVGHNGAGKSTLLKIICGNVLPTEGNVIVHGNIQALLELGTGFHPEFTGRENIVASLGYMGCDSGEIGSMINEIIDFAEIGDFIDQPIKTYSAGMYARLAFATATSIEPEILIIDEILGAGDAYFACKCMERMKELTERSGATVLFVSHDLGSVQQMCERVIWVDHGRIVMDDDPITVTKAYYAAMLKKDEARIVARNKRGADIEKAGARESLPYSLAEQAEKKMNLSPPQGKSNLSELNKEFVLYQKSSDKFFSDYADILSVKTFRNAEESIIFPYAEDIVVEVEVSAAMNIEDCYLVFSLYTVNNFVVAVGNWPLSGGLKKGRRSYSFIVRDPNLRQAEYLLSIALVENANLPTNEVVKYYARWNRAVSFKVDEGEVGGMPLGTIGLQLYPSIGSSMERTG